MTMIGKRILFHEVRQNPNTDRVTAIIPHAGIIVDRIRKGGNTLYLVQADDREKPFEIFPEDIEKFISDQPEPTTTHEKISLPPKPI